MFWIGWPNNNQYRGQYQPPPTVSGNSQQWPQGNSRSTGPVPQSNPCVNNQWEHRYPSNNGQGNYQPGASAGPTSAAVQQNQQWSAITTPGIGQSSPLRSPSVPRSSLRIDGKSFNINLTPNIKGVCLLSILSRTFYLNIDIHIYKFNHYFFFRK